VSKTGAESVAGAKTFTDNTAVTKANPYLTINATTGNGHLQFKENNVTRGLTYWDAAGDVFRLRRYDTDGTTVTSELKFNDGHVSTDTVFRGVTPVGTTDLTTKDYVDTKVTAPVIVSGTTDTLAAGDVNVPIRYTNTSLVTVTIPTDASDDLADGFTCILYSEGAGGVTLSTTGITLTGSSPNTTIAQNEALVVIKTAVANTWMVIGGTSA
jgi:hypothetical protein